jgi:transposase
MAAPAGPGCRIETCSRASPSSLSTGSGWAKLPRQPGYGSGWTCWRRLHECPDAGVYDRLHQAVLDRLGEQGRLDWTRASLDLVSVRAKRGVS